MTWLTINNVQRAVTPKASNSELRFLCFAHIVMMTYICIKFQENISNSFRVTELTQKYYTEITIFKVRGYNLLKESDQGLHCLPFLYVF